MGDIFVALACFLGAFILHILWHRISVRLRKTSMINCLSYLFGAIALLLIQPKIGGTVSERLIGSSWFLYGTLSILAIILYFPRTLPGQTPLDDILTTIKQSKQGLTSKKICGLFSHQELIDIRLDQLIQSGFIKKINGTYRVTSKGQILAIGIRWLVKTVTNPVGG